MSKRQRFYFEVSGIGLNTGEREYPFNATFLVNKAVEQAKQMKKNYKNVSIDIFNAQNGVIATTGGDHFSGKLNRKELLGLIKEYKNIPCNR